MTIIEEDKLTVLVAFRWSKRFGHCYDCGLPAAYVLDSTDQDNFTSGLRCSICAAQAAANGERILWLFAETEEQS